MRRFFSLVVLALVLVLSSTAQAASGETVRKDDRMLTRLPNGLTVYIVKDSRFPLVATRLYVRTGSANEKPEQAGISHMLEHMVFKGTEHRPKGQVARDVEALGGYLNAATSFDKTWYMTDMPAAHWRTGMDVVKEMAFQPSLDPKELESEKEVVISELERDQDSPMSRLFESLQTSALQHTVYGRPIIGFKDTIRAITAEDLRAYVRHWYQPQNMLLLVAGDIEPEAVLAYSQKLFGGLTNSGDLAETQPISLADASGGPRVEVVHGPWNKVYMGMAFPAPGLRDLRSVDLDVLCYLLGGDGTSELYRKFKYEKQMVDSIGMGNMSLARAGLVYLSAQLDVEKVEPFWRELTRDMAALKAESFKPEAIARARFNLEDNMDRAGETLNGLASWLGTVQFELGGEQAEMNLRFAQRNVDTAQLAQALQQWINPRQARVRVLAPEGAKLPDLEAILQQNWPGTDGDHAQKTRAMKAGEREVVQLGEGRTLILLPDATVPYVAMDMMLPGGNALLKPNQQGLAGLTARALTTGSGKLDAQAMERFFADRAAAIDASAGLQSFTLSVTGPARFNADYFSMLAEVLHSPRFEEKEIRREADSMKAAIRQRADRPTAYLFSRLNGFLFPGGQPYGYDGLGSAEILDRLTGKEVRAFWQEQLGQPWVLSVAGDFDREAVLAFARSLPVPKTHIAAPGAPVWGQDKKLDLHLPGRNQAHVLRTFEAVPPTHEDAPALMLLQSVLSGQSGLLFSQLRDVEGLGYTVTAFYRSMPEAGMMAFYIGTTPDKVDQAQKGFAKIIGDIREKPLPATLLEAGANRLLGAYYRDRQSLGSRAADAASDALLGRPYDFERQLIEKAAKLTPAQVQAVAKKYLDEANAYNLVLLP